MRESAPTGAEAIPRQVARVRRRWNGYAVARTLSSAIAVAAGVVALLVALALTSGPRPFTIGCAVLATTLLVATGWLLLRLGRDWLGARRAPAWIDQRASLEGRLATLLELRARAADAFFFPLLEAENERQLARWEPHRLVPHAVPRGALVTAVAALATLVTVLLLAPTLVPSPPRVRSDDVVVHAVAPRPGEVATRVTSVGPEADGAPPRASALGTPPERQTLAEALQKRIQRKLWGDDARTEARRPPRPPQGTPSEEQGDTASQDSWQVAKDSRGERRARPAPEQPAPQAQLEAAGEGAADDPVHAPTDRKERPVGSGGGASGAGDGTDPNLFGAAETGSDAPSGRFELGIVARVRTRRAAPRPPTGEAPPAAPDERPALGARQRQDVAVRRMVVPPGFEPIVRQVFAHGTEAQ